MSLRVVLAGGGTAGHVNPLLATAHALRQKGAQTVVLGTQEGLEKDLVPSAGLQLVTIPKVPMPRRLSSEVFRVPGKLRQAVDKATSVIEGADVVVGFGGYVAAPAYIAATRLKVPFVVHEQNVRPGWANRVGALTASGVGLTFPDTRLRARRGTTTVTGLPMRTQIMDLAALRRDPVAALEEQKRARLAFGLAPDLPTLLVTGGSLGARHLNDILIEAAPGIREPVQILHITGRGKVDEALAAASDPAVTVPWVIREYIQDMDRAMACADLVLCRSGAGTVAELTALGLPAVYVPFPIGNGEQALNARAQVDAGGALLVYDQDFGLPVFHDLVLPLLQDFARLQQMSRASRSVSPGDGAANLIEMIEAAV